MEDSSIVNGYKASCQLQQEPFLQKPGLYFISTKLIFLCGRDVRPMALGQTVDSCQMVFRRLSAVLVLSASAVLPCGRVFVRNIGIICVCSILMCWSRVLVLSVSAVLPCACQEHWHCPRQQYCHVCVRSISIVHVSSFAISGVQLLFVSAVLPCHALVRSIGIVCGSSIAMCLSGVLAFSRNQILRT